MLQIVRLTLDDDSNVIARRDLQPLFELREHAMLMARNATSGSGETTGTTRSGIASGQVTAADARIVSSWSSLRLLKWQHEAP